MRDARGYRASGYSVKPSGVYIPSSLIFHPVGHSTSHQDPAFCVRFNNALFYIPLAPESQEMFAFE